MWKKTAGKIFISLSSFSGQQNSISLQKIQPDKGPSNNYNVGGWGGGQKMSVFVHTQGIKLSTHGGGGQKMAKFCPYSC